ncbi:hypothetical protein [Rhizobacter sp. Root1221]|uniref:hypothetical protein n=1 Tax=Rhizobacter sp. Root1221 TaxID=1736433 RepID=UPI000701A6F9|nr:hypothetical protein [Rhizobacter sp. Root1221]KQV90441.1 hypothetical protein ASC87_28240 [Rhizobacter sp. Root1221]
MSELTFERHEARTKDGRRVALWTLARASGPVHPTPIVIGAGFALRMHHLVSVAMYCAHNGFAVCRYDPVNHVGLSEGDMWDFTLSDSLQSLQAAVDWMCTRTGRQQVAVVATSLTARVAFELAAQSDRVGLVVTAVGVTHVRETLKRVFGDDFSQYAAKDLPECIVHERKKIGRNFVADAHAHDWWSLDGCIRSLRRVRKPLVNFIGSDDAWVDPADVHRAFSEGSAGPRKLLTLDRAPHDLSRDASVARTFLTRTVEELLSAEGVKDSARVPPFEALMDQALNERRIQRHSPNHAA